MAYTLRCSACQRAAPSALMARLNEVAASGSISSSAAVPTRMKGRLGMSRGDGGQVQPHVEPGVAQEVQQAIEEGEQPQHAPQPRQACQAWPGAAA
jgi:hypothetical protein